MEKIKTGLAAFGMSGQIFHAPFISTNPAFCLTAITERNKNLSKERYPSARIVRSFEELVALDELELVVINTPDSTHYEYTRKALEAGKNVLCEKAFTVNADQARKLFALAKGISRPRSVQRPGYKRISEQALGFGFPYSSGNTE